MKIAFIEKSKTGPFLRLYDFSNEEVREVKTLIDDMTKGKRPSVAVHEHANINPADNEHLTLVLGKENKGIRFDSKRKEFVCELTKSSFENMAQLMASFALHPVEMQGFHWLDETSDISLLISPTGRWE